jgi:PAS domain-containing protein
MHRTPAANAAVLGLLAVLIIKYRIYDLLPVGRHQAVEVMGDGYLLINREETIVDHNRMAPRLTPWAPGGRCGSSRTSSAIPDSCRSSGYRQGPFELCYASSLPGQKGIPAETP